MFSAPTLQTRSVMNKQNKRYLQLTEQLRYQISALLKTGMTNKEIAAQIGVHPGTIGRELKRNMTGNSYDPCKAHKLSTERKKKAKKASKRSSITDRIIRESLLIGWSPEAISQRLKLEAEPASQLSHTTIYRRIEEDRIKGGLLYRQLPHHGKIRWKGGKRSRRAGAKLIPDRVDISCRPEVVEQRSRLGDWEGDTIHGKNAYLVTVVERASRFTLVKRVLSKTKESVACALVDLLKRVSSVRTLTLDNGGEFAAHSRITEATGAQVYFAKPYCSWQRGTNENINGRIRRFWPKKFDMAVLSEEEISDNIFLLNATPRKVLGGLTPWEVFTGKRVALIT